ncbi:MAG TPA: sugar phosphate isomerase/epimerase family protein [Acidobacteriota bacterium]|nr:sugar phosphate isomerase/epimerase family protein [Acidobacteriota bacterium]
MSRITRRRFTQSLAVALAAPSIIMSRAKAKKVPIAFSTLGCPKWEWKKILQEASRLGYAAIELRGIQGEMDLTKRPEFNGDHLQESLRDLDALDLRISDLGASSRMHEQDAAKRAAQLDEGKRFIDLAHRLKAPYVRVFGNNYVKEEPREKTVERIITGLKELKEHAQGSGVEVIIESHGDFADSQKLLEILKGAGINLLWDAHHTVVAGKENPQYTVKQLGRYIRHTHLKDSTPVGNDVRYVLTGEGTVPVREIVRVLAASGYRGYYCFEWEKMWHPDIDEPEVAFPQYAKVMRQYLAEAG